MNHKKVTFGQRWVQLAMLLSLLVIQNSVLKAADVTLSWAPNSESDLAGYKVHYGTSSRAYSSTVNVGNTTSHTVTGLGSGTYYFALTAYDTSNNESGYSAEAVKTMTATPDATPPVLSAIQATSIANTAATITWTSNEASDTQVEYGVTTAYGSSTSLNTAQVTAHSQGLVGLVANTTYHYRVKSKDVAGNLAVSGNSTFTTTNTTLSGPVAAYSFDEGSGSSVSDASGNSNNGTISGTTWTPSGKFGSALSFDGSTSLVSVPHSSSLALTSAMTLEAWVYPTAAQTGWRNVIKKEVDSFFLNSSTGNNVAGAGATFSGGMGIVYGTSATPTNTWTHLAATYDGASLKYYVNGVVVSTASVSGNIQPTSLPLRIGGDTVYGERVQGMIDEVRVYNRALMQAEIHADMNIPIGAPPPAVSRCDCSADGLTNAVDVQVLVNAILAGSNDSSYDINRSGTVDVLDLQVLGNVILGVAVCP